MQNQTDSATGRGGEVQIPRGSSPAASGEDAPRARSSGSPSEGVTGIESLLGDIPLELSVELGRTKLSLREIAAQLGPGSMIALEKLTGDLLDIRVNARLVARGEAVAIGERYGIRVVQVMGEDGEPR
ncbi:MAG: flagellar motor switch protein FliN [Deltaproteobacteria bacterium]|nr:flagellar motor switch protein FliN [Deltaproteobacteria bacterium]